MYVHVCACMCRQVRFDRAVTGVAMSPSGDFVCTSHAGSLGIYLWANRTHFANVFLGYSAPSDPTGLATLPPPSCSLSLPVLLSSFPFLCMSSLVLCIVQPFSCRARYPKPFVARKKRCFGLLRRPKHRFSAQFRRRWAAGVRAGGALDERVLK